VNATDSRTPRRPRHAALAAAVALGALALTACDPLQPGSAAVVGTERITETEVNTAAYEAAEAQREAGLEPDVAELMRRQVDVRVATVLLEELADTYDVEVTRGQVDAFIRQGGGAEAWEASLVERGLSPEQAREFARIQVLIDAVAEAIDPETGFTQIGAEAAALSEELGVEISPRYGQWDSQQVTIVAAVDDVSQPAGGPAA
jgi:hypothetical protein